MNSENIMITDKDLLKIRSILGNVGGENLENLDYELERATVIPVQEAPNDLVTMHSKVKILNVQDNKEMVVTLVYPNETNTAEGKISILAPLGSAIIGLRVDQEINWTFPDKKEKTLRVLEVIEQNTSTPN